MNLYLGCGPGQVHQQHLDIMGDLSDWVFVDKYVKRDDIKPWDAEVLSEVEDGTIGKIYNSHLLEHISHRRVQDILALWYRKLKKGGEIIINVPDLEWACWSFLEVLMAERTGQKFPGYYHHTIKFEDHEHDFLQIFYGSQANDGEYHKCGFTKESMKMLLENTGFKDIKIQQAVEAHDMGCLIVSAIK